MSVKPANRQADRMRKALKEAFRDLLDEFSYDAITVGDIADRANVGRSTFYRHYESKGDLLLEWHEDVFAMLRLGDYTADEWLADEPPAPLTAFFEGMQHARMSLHNFGKDGAFTLRRIGAIMTQQIEENLRRSFPDLRLTMPLTVAAQAAAGILVWNFQWWIMERPSYTPAQMAAYTHRMVRGAISAAMEGSR